MSIYQGVFFKRTDLSSRPSLPRFRMLQLRVGGINGITSILGATDFDRQVDSEEGQSGLAVSRR